MNNNNNPKDGSSVGEKIVRESSYDFWHDTGKGGTDIEKGTDSDFDFPHMKEEEEEDDPPSKLIGQFLNKQRASGDVCLDMDMEMAELQNSNATTTQQPKTTTTTTLPPVPESPSSSSTQQRVSFGSVGSIRKRNSLPQQQQNGEILGEEIVKCSSRDSSLQRKSSLLKEKNNNNKSRLMDPPPTRSGPIRSQQLKSGHVGRVNNNNEEDEDDPLLEDDLPEEISTERFDFLLFLEWLSLVLIIGALVCTLTIPFLKRRSLWNLKLWKWAVLIFVLTCGRLISSWIVRIVVFFIERNFLLRKRVLYFVYGVKKAVQNCLWLGLVLIAWHFLFDKKVHRDKNIRVLRMITKILVCMFVGVLLWLVKTLMVKVLASSFHVSTFFDRIQESLFNQYVVETLSGPPLIEKERNTEEEQKLAEEVAKLQNVNGVDLKVPTPATSSSQENGRPIRSGILERSPRMLTSKSPKFARAPSGKGSEGITIDHLHKLNHRNVSAWNMKRLMNIVRHGALSTLDEHIQNSTHEDESTTKIISEYEAQAAARKIFHNVARQCSRYIYLEDIMRFMREDEALKTLNLFEGCSESKKISKSALKNWVVYAFRERRALALTLNDTKTAVNKLHNMVNIILGIIILIIWLIILGIATTKFLVVISSQLVLVAFVFGNTCKTVFEAIIFLFVTHPFDVGDRCEIEGVQMIVEEMNILTTVFLRFDNQKIICANSVLATKSIGNYNRSPDMGDAVELFVHMDTSPEKICQLKERINSYIEKKEEHWAPAPMIVLREIVQFNMVKIAVWPNHRMNHQDMGERFIRRSQLVAEIIKIIKELGIQYRVDPIDINLCSVPPPSVTSERLPKGWA